METKNTDLAIIGGGPGGYVAAIRASKLGINTTIIEKDNLGGTCLNWGCIPTKALIHICEVIEEIKQSGMFGINIKGYSLDFKKAMERKDRIIAAQRQGIAYHLKKNKIEHISGKGKFISDKTIGVQAGSGEDININAKNIIIATGSYAGSVPPFELDNDGILDNIGILSLKDIPERLLVVGGGVVGSEFANIFASFGSKVTIVEMLPEILSTEDTEVSRVIQKVFEKKGIRVLTDTVIENVKKSNNKYICLTRQKEEIEVDKILVSVGRKPCSSGIGLEIAGVKTDAGGFIQVDSQLKTNVPGIYAAGDVIGGYQLAHVASEEGKIAVENIAGKEKEIDYRVIPWAVFTSPEIGTVGINEKQAREKGYDVRCGVFPFTSSGKAYTTGHTEGFVKIVVDNETNEILGAQMVGPRCSDLVHEVAVAMKGEMVIENLAETVHSHPTLSEAVMEAAEDCLGLATHISR